MLDSLRPLTLIYSTIVPIHLAVTFSDILFKIAFVEISTLPVKLTVSILQIVEIVTNVSVSSLVLPWPFPRALAFFEGTLENALLQLPVIFSFSLRKAIHIRTLIHIAIFEKLSSFSMFCKILEISFKFWLICLEHCETMHLTKSPLPRITRHLPYHRTKSMS